MPSATTPPPDQGRPDIRDGDPIAALFINYFSVCTNMKEYVAYLWQCLDDFKTEDERALFGISRVVPCLGAWQASLYPVITGFKKLGLRDERVDPLINQHLSYIRSTAKTVHNYQDHATYITQRELLEGRVQRGEVPNLRTVTDLHDELDNFFNKQMFDKRNVSHSTCRKRSRGRSTDRKAVAQQ